MQEVEPIPLCPRLVAEDRKFAWWLYKQLDSRTGVTGNPADATGSISEYEVYAESVESCYRVITAIREEVCHLPVFELEPGERMAAVLFGDVTMDVLRRFLDRWQSDVRWWSRLGEAQGQNPREWQRNFAEQDRLLADWKQARLDLRKIRQELAAQYGFHDYRSEAEELRGRWLGW